MEEQNVNSELEEREDDKDTTPAQPTEVAPPEEPETFDEDAATDPGAEPDFDAEETDEDEA